MTLWARFNPRSGGSDGVSKIKMALHQCVVGQQSTTARLL